MAKELTLADIEQMTQDFADARNEMLAVGDAFNVDLEAVRQAHLSTLTAAARDATAKMNALYDAINANAHLFAAKGAKRKVFAGITVGLQAGKAKVVSAEEAPTFYGTVSETDQGLADQLVKVEYSFRQAALNALDDAKLPALNLTRVPGKDTPLVKPLDEEAAKVVDALIKQFVADDE